MTEVPEAHNTALPSPRSEEKDLAALGAPPQGGEMGMTTGLGTADALGRLGHIATIGTGPAKAHALPDRVIQPTAESMADEGSSDTAGPDGEAHGPKSVDHNGQAPENEGESPEAVGGAPPNKPPTNDKPVPSPGGEEPEGGDERMESSDWHQDKEATEGVEGQMDRESREAGDKELSVDDIQRLVDEEGLAALDRPDVQYALDRMREAVDAEAEEGFRAHEQQQRDEQGNDEPPTLTRRDPEKQYWEHPIRDPNEKVAGPPLPQPDTDDAVIAAMEVANRYEELQKGLDAARRAEELGELGEPPVEEWQRGNGTDGQLPPQPGPEDDKDT